jgi:hypothetical protein
MAKEILPSFGLTTDFYSVDIHAGSFGGTSVISNQFA